MFHVKLVEVAFNQEKDLVGTFSVIVKFSRTFVQPSFEALVPSHSVLRNTISKEHVVVETIIKVNDG